MAGPKRGFLGPTPEFPALMTDQMTLMRNDGFLTNFTITALEDEPQFHCHKLVLAIHSSYFKAMFAESTINSVHIDEISTETMRIIIDYCYYEQIEFPDDQLISLITASDFLQIKRLNQRCLNEVKTFLNPENVLQYLTFAVEQNKKDIRAWCMQMIVNNFPEVSMQESFLALTYAELQECLTKVLQSDVKRDDVLYAGLRWISDNAAERDKYLEELLQQVQLNRCTLPGILDAMEAHKTIIAANLKVFSLLTKSISHITAQSEKSPEPPVQPKPAQKSSEPSAQSIPVHKSPEPPVQTKPVQKSEPSVQSEPVQKSPEPPAQSNSVEKSSEPPAQSKPVQKSSEPPAQTESIQKSPEPPAQTEPVEKSSEAMKAKRTEKQLVIVGGQVGEGVSPDCWSLDTKQNKFTKMCSIPAHILASKHSVCSIPKGFVLTGGVDSELCVVFQAATKRWKRMTNMLRKRYGHASVYINGKLYVLCGFVSSNNSASVDCLTLESGQWESLRDCPVAGEEPKVAELDGKLYMYINYRKYMQGYMRGYDYRLQQFDVEKNEWKKLESCPLEADMSVCMIAVNGQLCVAGEGERKKVCAWYNPTSQTWSLGQQKPIKNHIHGSLIQQDSNTLLLLGGSVFLGGTDDIEELNLTTGSWSLSNIRMPLRGMHHHTAMYLNIPSE